MNEIIISNFVEKVLSSSVKEIFINGNKLLLNKGHNYAINNQEGELAKANFFGKELEFTVEGNDLKMPISIQLYKNISGHYRIFVYNNKGMIVSVNLSKGYSDGVIRLEIQMKLTNSNMSQGERENNRDMLVNDLVQEGIEIIKNNTVYFGKYDVVDNNFIDTTADKFLEQLIKVAIIKGHYMKNKGYRLTII